MPSHLGDRVNFWGSQWAKQVSGGDFDNTADFKGWAIPAGSPVALCEPAQHADDKCWTSKPGQPFPPSTIERYIRVMVSTSIGQELGEIYGNIAAVVIVRVDPVPQYRNDPGKPGFGTIVAVIADGAHLFSASKLHIATTSIAFEYIWFNGHPVAQLDVATNTTHWTFTDHLGTPIIETNGDGTTYWRAEYEPYGAVFSLRSPDVYQPLRLPGQEAEQLDTGANGATEREYNIFRWYRGGWGRYSQSDPIGLKSTPHLFVYALEAPLNYFDTTGLLARPDDPCFRGFFGRRRWS